MSRKGTGTYPSGWPDFAIQLKTEANWTCVRCCHPHEPETGHTLTVHHLSMAKDEPFEHWWAFLPLCQRCHLSIQGRVDLNRPWVMAEHSEWFKVFAGGYFAWKYLGLVVPRNEVEAELEWFVNIERRELGILPKSPRPSAEMVVK